MKKIIQGDCIEGMRTLPDQSVNCCVTSPPYFGLRDYGHEGQIGLEETPEQFVAKMVEVFREVKRVLKDDGTLWLNLGDSYASNSKGSGGPSKKQDSNAGSRYESRKFNHGVKEKDLIGIPWMVAFALRADGWYLRQDIIWHKPNPMPESVTDRCTKSHEYIFLLSKSQKYYYDNEAIKQESIEPIRAREKNNGESAVYTKMRGHDGNCGNDGMANKRSVWTVTTKPYSEAHFATYPPDLIVDCIKAGCPEKTYTCSCCGFSVNLYESNTIANETTYQELQKMWRRISGNRPMEQRENFLYQEMQFNMDGREQGIHKGVDNLIEGIQDDYVAKSPKQNQIRVCDGTQAGYGGTPGEAFGENGSDTPQGSRQTEQPHIKSGTTKEGDTRQVAEAANKGDLLSALWEEDKSVGACPKCGKGELIGKRGITLDCFMGAGTTAMVARKLNRNYVGFELNPEYIRIAQNRLQTELGMFA